MRYTISKAADAAGLDSLGGLSLSSAPYSVHVAAGRPWVGASPLADGAREFANFFGGTGDDIQDGTTGDDFFGYAQGGNDTLHGLDGNDIFAMGLALNPADVIDGGIGDDTVQIGDPPGFARPGAGHDPDFATFNITFNATTITNVERLELAFGRNYRITTNDGNVAAGATLHIDGRDIFNGALDFDGSAETDGNFIIDGGEGIANDSMTGGAGNDVISAGDGNDTIDAGAGDDQVYGGDGKDFITALGNGSFVDGGEGGDTIHVDGGGAYLALGGDGNDNVYFSGQIFSDQIILGQNGSDTLHLTDFVDVYVTNWGPAGAGFETLILEPASGAVVVSARDAGNTTIDFSGVAASTNGAHLEIHGGLGDDTLIGSSLDDTIIDDTGNNTLYGRDGNDTLTVLNSAGLNDLFGGDGDDGLTAGSGGGHLDGGNDNDTLTGSTAGTTNEYGGTGNDQIFADQGGTDFAYGGMGDDTVFFAGTIDQIEQIGGGTGTDTFALTGDLHIGLADFDPSALGFEQLAIAGGGTVIDGHAGDTTIDFSNVAIVALARHGDFGPGVGLHIIGNAGNDTLTATDLDDTIEDSSGDNTMFGLLGDDVLSVTGGGANALYGGGGNDTIIADPINNTLNGGGGDDTIRIAGTVNAGTGILAGGGDDTMEITGDLHIAVSGFTPSAQGFENVTITPGSGDVSVIDDDTFNTTIDFSGVDMLSNGALFRIVGASGDDTLTGSSIQDIITDSSGSNTLAGLVGDDFLTVTGAGNNIIYGGNDEDVLTAAGTAGQNALYGGDDIDILDATGATGLNTLDGGQGDDTIDATGATASQFIYGGGGNDNMTGGNTGDSIDAGIGNDKVKAAAGDDSIFMAAALNADDRIDGGSEFDTVVLSGDYTGGNAVTFLSTTMKNVERLSLGSGFSYEIVTDDATVGKNQTLEVSAFSLFSNSSLTFDGSAETNGSFLVDGGEGGDTITGGAKADTIYGGNGDDTLDGHGGLDAIYGGSGADQILALTGAGTIDGGEGNDTVTFSGNFTAQTVMTGGAGANDTLQLTGTINVKAAVFDVGAMSFENVTLLTDVTIQGDNQNNTIDLSGVTFAPGHTLTIDGGAGNDIVTGSNLDDTIQDSDGDNVLLGLGGNDTIDIHNSTGTNTIDGGSGNDNLIAGTGTDTLIGGAGKDTLTGGTAGNQFLYGGTGADTIFANTGGHATVDGGDGNDSVLFAGVIDTSNQILGGAGFDTLFLTGDVDIQIGNFDPAALGFERVVLGGFGFAGEHGPGGTVTVSGDDTANVISFAGVDLIPGGSTLVIEGRGDNDTLTGSLLDDMIFGGSGSDIIDGGTGDDALNGGSGDDDFAMGADFTAGDSVNGGSGYDQIVLNGDYTGPNAVDFLSGTLTNIEEIILVGENSYEITTDDAAVGAGESLRINGLSLFSSDTLTFDGSAETDGAFVVEGGDGGDDLTGGAQDDSLYGGDGDDQIQALAGADTVDGAEGNDDIAFAGTINTAHQIEGGDDTDTLILSLPIAVNASNFSPSDNGFELVQLLATTTLTGSGGDTTIDFSGVTVSADAPSFRLVLDGVGGNDTLTGSNWRDTLIGGAGDNTLSGLDDDDILDVTGSVGTNTLFGGDGDDTLVAGGGSDTLTGGLGLDHLIGGAGSATLNGGDDADLIEANNGGTYTVDAGNGDDEVLFSGAVTGPDQLFGGAGTDRLSLNGTLKIKVDTFAPGSLGFEEVQLNAPVTVEGNSANNVIDFSGVTVSLGPVARKEFAPGDFTINGGAGDDTLTGSNFGETILGGSGNNALAGLDGDDILDVSLFSGANSLFGGNGGDTLLAGGGDDELDGGAGADHMVGGLGTALFYGGAGNDEIEANHGGNYTVDAGAGKDTVHFSGTYSNAGQLAGGTGQDTLVLHDIVKVHTATFDPASMGFEAVELVSGQARPGADSGAGATVTVRGDSSANVIDFTGLTVTGDLLVIDGSNGDDTLVGSNIQDTILGKGGNDTIDGGSGGNDHLDGGAGRNRVVFDNVNGVHVSLATAGAQDIGGGRMVSLSQFQDLTGSSGNDVLGGDNGANDIDGGDGTDTLIGSGGVDNLDGGAGADTFVFEDTSDSGITGGERDIVAFNQGQGDIIDLEAIDADTTQDGNQAFHFSDAGNFSGTPGELIALVLGSHTVVFGDVDGDGLSDFGIELTSATALSADDFVL